ncbi:hypothetical protein GJAV_G00150760 [Gymnothorax javanicus]|nr:hypothetical protein GJAV_G00150760 [Gymnothorax javanicus]
MSESAEANMSSRRNVTIEITNHTREFCLADPKVYLDSGEVHNPPQPTVRPQKTEICSFTKTSGKTSGSVGVLTYHLLERRSKDKDLLSIMFSIPYDYNLYKNWFAVGIYSEDRDVDESLFNEMYNDEKENFVRGEAVGSGIRYLGKDLDVRASMSPMGRAIMKVEIWDKVFTDQGQRTLW